MALNGSQYYMPYESDTDTISDATSDTGSDYDSDELPESEDPRIRREEDPRYAIISAAGPNFNTSEQQLKYMEHAPGAAYDPSTNITSLSSLTYLNPPKTTQTSLFSIKAINRDTAVWESPFNFTLKTPRVYKNVTKLQLVQISFPNNTQAIATPSNFIDAFITELVKGNIPADCISTCIDTINCGPNTTSLGIAEQGRYNTRGEQMYTVVGVSNGIYDGKKLAAELTRNSNNTPPFNIISYGEFKEIFQATRDASILFNEPGDYFISGLLPSGLGRHTKNDIMRVYYSQEHIDSHPIITDKIAFNAYYLPILKELLATKKAKPFLNTGGTQFEYIEIAVNGQDFGLDSDLYYNICLANKGTLDNYRKHLTFELRHLNKYIWSYNEDTRRFNVIHDCLHTSLQNDINNRYNSYFTYELSTNGFTINSFNSAKTNYSKQNAVFKHLESYLSTQLGNYMLGGSYQYFGGDNHSTSSTSYNYSTFLHNDATFTSMFNFSGTFGNTGQQYNNNAGVNFTFTNFLDYHSTISSYYNVTTSLNSTISSITGTVNDRHHQYISTKYTGVLPQHIINNKSYKNCKGVGAAFVGNKYVYTPGDSINNQFLTAQSLLVNPPLPSLTTSYSTCITDCCSIIEKIVIGWYSCLPVNSIINTLQYRLGLNQLNFNNFNAYSTISGLASTTNFNLLLQLNPSQSFNNMDIAMNENYTISNETTGQVKLIAAKILLAGVGAGEVTETAIQNPILFETPLGKLDKLEFKIYADDATLTPMWLYFPFEIGINDWDATFQIDEEVSFADRNAGWGTNPTVPIPNNPAALQYMALTGPNNPNNK
jgi:hypothetical protein